MCRDLITNELRRLYGTVRERCSLVWMQHGMADRINSHNSAVDGFFESGENAIRPIRITLQNATPYDTADVNCTRQATEMLHVTCKHIRLMISRVAYGIRHLP